MPILLLVPLSVFEQTYMTLGLMPITLSFACARTPELMAVVTGIMRMRIILAEALADLFDEELSYRERQLAHFYLRTVSGIRRGSVGVLANVATHIVSFLAPAPQFDYAPLHMRLSAFRVPDDMPQVTDVLLPDLPDVITRLELHETARVVMEIHCDLADAIATRLEEIVRLRALL
jgi:hypothetical protein